MKKKAEQALTSKGQPDFGSSHRSRHEGPAYGLMSGETLRAPRQQLRLLRAWGLCVSLALSRTMRDPPELLGRVFCNID